MSILEILCLVYSEAAFYVYFWEPLPCLFYRHVVISILEIPYHFYFRDPLTLAVLQLRENGELDRLKKKWWYENSQCDPDTEKVYKYIMI